jgi:S1-C subfamily serine protease
VDAIQTGSRSAAVCEAIMRKRNTPVDQGSTSTFYNPVGFFTSSNGYFVTNAHVIVGALRRSDIIAMANDDTHYLVERIGYVDPDADIVILKFNCTDVASLQRNSITMLQRGKLS